MVSNFSGKTSSKGRNGWSFDLLNDVAAIEWQNYQDLKQLQKEQDKLQKNRQPSILACLDMRHVQSSLHFRQRSPAFHMGFDRQQEYACIGFRKPCQGPCDAG